MFGASADSENFWVLLFVALVVDVGYVESDCTVRRFVIGTDVDFITTFMASLHLFHHVQIPLVTVSSVARQRNSFLEGDVATSHVPATGESFDKEPSYFRSQSEELL